jgi:hypothetical protein
MIEELLCEDNLVETFCHRELDKRTRKHDTSLPTYSRRLDQQGNYVNKSIDPYDQKYLQSSNQGYQQSTRSTNMNSDIVDLKVNSNNTQSLNNASTIHSTLYPNAYEPISSALQGDRVQRPDNLNSSFVLKTNSILLDQLTDKQGLLTQGNKINMNNSISIIPSHNDTKKERFMNSNY